MGGELARSLKYLILAIAFWNILFIVLSNGSRIVVGILKNIDVSIALRETFKSLLGMIFCWDKDFLPKITPFWFVWVLVMIKIVYGFLNKLDRTRKIYMGCLCVVYCVLANLAHKSLPFLLDRLIIAMPFYICGNLFRVEKWDAKVFGLPFTYKLSIVFMCLLVMLLTLNYSGSYDMFSMYYYTGGRSILWYYLISFMGTIALLLCCERLSSNKYVELLSEGTLLILATHLSVMKILDKFGLFYIEPTEILVCSLLCVLCIPFILFSRKYFPYALGKSKK